MSYIYVIEFDDGLIKVGRTRRPDQRIKTHESNVFNFTKKKIKNRWVSNSHGNCNQNELLLVRFCSSKGESTGSREWFSGVIFDEVVSYAKSLQFSDKNVIEKISFDKFSHPFFDANIEARKVNLAYRCALSLELFISESLWVSGEIFKKDSVSGLSGFVIVMAAYFLIDDPINKLVESVSELSHAAGSGDEVGAIDSLFQDALNYVKSI